MRHTSAVLPSTISFVFGIYFHERGWILDVASYIEACLAQIDNIVSCVGYYGTNYSIATNWLCGLYANCMRKYVTPALENIVERHKS